MESLSHSVSVLIPFCLYRVDYSRRLIDGFLSKVGVGRKVKTLGMTFVDRHLVVVVLARGKRLGFCRVKFGIHR